VNERMGTQLAIAGKMIAFAQKVQVELAEHRRKAVYVVELVLYRADCGAQPIAERPLPIGQRRDKEACRVDPSADPRNRSCRRIDDRHRRRRRRHRPDNDPVGCLVHPKERERFVMARLDDRSDLGINPTGHRHPLPLNQDVENAADRDADQARPIRQFVGHLLDGLFEEEERQHFANLLFAGGIGGAKAFDGAMPSGLRQLRHGVELAAETPEIADAVLIGVKERLDVHLVDDRLLVSQRVRSIRVR